MDHEQVSGIVYIFITRPFANKSSIDPVSCPHVQTCLTQFRAPLPSKQAIKIAETGGKEIVVDLTELPEHDSSGLQTKINLSCLLLLSGQHPDGDPGSLITETKSTQKLLANPITSEYAHVTAACSLQDTAEDADPAERLKLIIERASADHVARSKGASQ